MVQKLKSKKILLGLTGSFGCGKSTVSQAFVQLGAGHVDADAIVHDVLSRKGPVYDQVAKLFQGTKIRGSRTSVRGSLLDRKKIAAVVFRDPVKRKKLEAILHPYVFERMLDDMAGMKQKVVILDVPLLFETGFDRYCHKTLVVQSPPDVVRRRLSKRGFSEKEVIARQKVQMPLKAKIKRADYVIDNGGSLVKTQEQVRQIWKKLHS